MKTNPAGSLLRRMLGPAALAVCLLLCFGSAARAAERQVIKGSVPEAVTRLAPVDRLKADQQLHLAIGLPLRDRPSLDQLIRSLYDPASPSHRRFLTPEQFTARFGPSESDYQAVAQFAVSHGLTVRATHPNRLLLEVTGSVADIEKAFRVNLRVYPHPVEARTFYAADTEPSLDLNVPVLAVAGMDNYNIPRAAIHRIHPAARIGAGSGQEGSYVGLDFRAAYLPGVPLNGAGQSVGLFELDGYYLADVTNYLNMPASGLTNSPVVLSNVVLPGFSGPPGPNNVEVALDIDMAISMAPGLSNVFVYEAPAEQSGVDGIFNRMATDNLAAQLSSSWFGFSDDTIMEQAMQEFIVQGQSFFECSGDSGAYTVVKNPVPPPLDNPCLTIVGGTSLKTTGPQGAWVSETTWNWFTTGEAGGAGSGGVSPTFAIPIWQQGISMSANQGSTNFRNIPDVSMNADALFIFADNGSPYYVGGTSAATPLWAGLTALVNQQNAALSQPRIGFLNPVLYDLARGPNYLACFHDITTGNNTNFNVIGKYYATNGYDLCTGWGTPNGSNLITALVQNGGWDFTALNGGFETGDTTYWNLVQDPGENDVVLSEADIADIFQIGYGGAAEYIHSGTYSMLMGQVASQAHLSQTLSTFPGQPYLISFWLANPGLADNGAVLPNEFSFSWNGASLFDQVNMPVFSWTNLQFVVAATTNQTVLNFGAQNAEDFFSLDDIGAQAVPAPVFQQAVFTNGNFALNWSALQGMAYQLQYSTNLGGTNWTNLGAPLTATNGSVTAADVLPADPQRFYRLNLLP